MEQKYSYNLQVFDMVVCKQYVSSMSALLAAFTRIVSVITIVLKEHSTFWKKLLPSLGEITNHKTQLTKNVTRTSAYSYWI
jgi:hypothetical protein